MNYYIQGNAAKADKIKAAFERNGIDTSANSNYGISNLFYYSYNGEVAVTQNRSIINIIKTHPDYKELELQVEPKFNVGDWIVYENGDTFAGGFKEVQVKTVEKINRYTFTHNTNGSCNFIDRNCRLWTIADAKDGDVLVTTNVRSCPFIYRKTDYNNNLAYYYAGIDGNGNFCEGCLKRTLFHFGSVKNVVPATKEQRDLLFAKMKEAGYEWDADKKELRKIQPHYEVKNFHVGMPVLVRDENGGQWIYTTYSHYDSSREYKFMTSACEGFVQCIPYEGNEHLLGTTDKCDEQYINW